VYGARITLLDANVPTFPSAPAGALVTSSILNRLVAGDRRLRGPGRRAADEQSCSPEGQVVRRPSFDTNGRCRRVIPRRDRPVPAERAAGRLTLNSTTLADGGYAMSVRLVDVAGNQAS